jgi:hypothetical protein
MEVHRNWIKAWVVAVALMLAACATSPEPFEYQSDNELKPGAGSLTGEEGVWTIMRQAPPAEPETPPAEDENAPAGAAPAAADASVPTDTGADEP